MVIINSFYFAVFYYTGNCYVLLPLFLFFFIQGNVDTKLNKELGADPDVV